MLGDLHRDKVFVAGGQPTVTYVERRSLHMERNLVRAIATPNQIVSLSGPTKTGKTVLCRKVLAQRQYIWIDGGQINSADVFWEHVRSELSIPYEEERSEEQEDSLQGNVSSIVVTAAGSHLFRNSIISRKKINSMIELINIMVENDVILVIDDFHYIDRETRSTLMRNIKGAVFNGLKVVLLSVMHRTFDAIKAEPELTGRFMSVQLTEWSDDDLRQIPSLGFKSLKVKCDNILIGELIEESQESPFLMQKFCWEICFDHSIEKPALLRGHEITADYPLEGMFRRIAEDAGLPIYQALVAGPQSRSDRIKRPLRDGRQADKYEATLLALAETGPKSSVTYEELRAILGEILTDNVPQKHEITSALKHLAIIAASSGNPNAIDWDEEKRSVSLPDPYLRFYLRWQVRSN